MVNTIETYSDELLCAAILKKNFSSVGREFIDDQVTAIRHYAFNNCSIIDTVKCPNATVIGRQAFSGCRATEVELPWDRITKTDYRGFYGTAAQSTNPTKQKDLVLSSLEIMGEYAFGNGGSYTPDIPLKYI